MIIDFSSKSGYRIRIPFPTWLGINRLSLGIARAVYREKLQEMEIELTWEDMSRWLRVFRQCERRYKGMCIVDVQEADGDTVKIYL